MWGLHTKYLSPCSNFLFPSHIDFTVLLLPSHSTLSSIIPNSDACSPGLNSPNTDHYLILIPKITLCVSASPLPLDRPFHSPACHSLMLAIFSPYWHTLRRFGILLSLLNRPTLLMTLTHFIHTIIFISCSYINASPP